MLDDALPAMAPDLEALIDPPAPEHGAETLAAYGAMRARMAGEPISQIATGEGAKVQDILRYYALCRTCDAVEGAEALLATLGTLPEGAALQGVSAVTPDAVLLVITDAEDRYLAHVLQPRQRVQ